MYSDKKNVLQLVALLKAHGITNIVLSPGSRNSPLIHSFASDNHFTCYSIVDERSAGFFALGIIQATGKPAAVCCTSGTAALNLGPAVAEAFYQQLPLLVITSDRSPAWIGQMDGQTIPQEGMFKEITRRSVHLPQISDEEEEWFCNRLINEAILSMDNGSKGPAHINIPLGEPLFGFNVATLPAVRVISQSAQGFRIHKEDGYDKRFAAHSKRMVIVGQLPPSIELESLYNNKLESLPGKELESIQGNPLENLPNNNPDISSNNNLDILPNNYLDNSTSNYSDISPSKNLADLLNQLREKWDVVVLAEQLSNIPIKETAAFDTVLYAASEERKKELAPDLLITLGGHIVSKRLKQFIRSANIREHWHISPSGEVTDTFQRVTDIIRSDAGTFLRYLAETPLVSDENDFSEKEGKGYLAQSENNFLRHNENDSTGQNPMNLLGHNPNDFLGQNPNDFRKLWENACSSIPEPKVAFSDLFAVGTLAHALPKNASLHVGNSNSVRLAQLFELPPSTRVFCNRGTNGIEGSLSTAVGYAAASGSPTFLLIGDLSFFFDLNGLWNRHVGKNLRIMLNNNGGGEIFGMLPGLNKSEALQGYIAAAHATEAKAWAEQQGFRYLSARNEDELRAQLPLFMEWDSSKPVLLEVFTSMQENAEQIRKYYHQQKKQ